MRYIPGSEREIPGEEKLTSLARFDALMREAEERRKAQERGAVISGGAKEGGLLKSAWEADIDADDGQVDRGGIDTDDSDYDGFDHGVGYGGDDSHKAVEFASRRSSVQAVPRSRHMTRNSLSYHESQSMTGSQPILRPHTAHSKSRPTMSPRATSQPQPVPPSLDRLAISTMPPAGEASTQRQHEKRNSVTSVKRLSFNEFTKRLSSTSSLLLVQTNQSTSSRGSSEMEGTQQPSTPRGLNPRGAPLSPDRDRDDRCGWRGSVGVFGDGGFV
ncbi:hypothetical protein SLS62_006829 [Diatrype stigma]|uniref:Uncharacterized protein n=1 Tax=Diatrype stigma TaxID=117547 RepID=A0AAN9V0J0_9PEZI